MDANHPLTQIMTLQLITTAVLSKCLSTDTLLWTAVLQPLVPLYKTSYRQAEVFYFCQRTRLYGVEGTRINTIKSFWWNDTDWGKPKSLRKLSHFHYAHQPSYKNCPGINQRLRYLRLPPRLNWILPSSVLLRGVKCCKTDVSGLPIGPIFKGQAVQVVRPLNVKHTGGPETSVLNHLKPRNNPKTEEFKHWPHNKGDDGTTQDTPHSQKPSDLP